MSNNIHVVRGHALRSLEKDEHEPERPWTMVCECGETRHTLTKKQGELRHTAHKKREMENA